MNIKLSNFTISPGLVHDSQHAKLCINAARGSGGLRNEVFQVIKREPFGSRGPGGPGGGENEDIFSLLLRGVQLILHNR